MQSNYKEVPVKEASPVMDKILTLSNTLFTARNGLDALGEKLNPIRTASLKAGQSGVPKVVEETELETRLAELIEQAQELSTGLNNLRAQVRI